MRAEPHALDAITIFEAGQIAKQRVFQDRHEIALEEDAGRLSACVLQNLDIVRRAGIARHPGARQRAQLATDGNGRRLHQPHTARM